MRRRIVYVLFIALLPIIAQAQDQVQDNTNYKSTFGISLGLDKNINGYRTDPNNAGNDFYSNKLGWNFGVDYGFMMGKKFRPRLEIRYLQQSYQAGWKNANMSTMKETNVRLFNLGANLHVDYLLYNKPKFQVFVSPAAKWEFTADKEIKNKKYDGTSNWSQYPNIINQNPGSVLGGAVSAIFKYNITKYIGATISPEYTMYLKNYADTNDKIYQRFGIGFGVEFNIF